MKLQPLRPDLSLNAIRSNSMHFFVPNAIEVNGYYVEVCVVAS